MVGNTCGETLVHAEPNSDSIMVDHPSSRTGCQRRIEIILLPVRPEVVSMEQIVINGI
jgi:hypothetical protein